MRAQTRRGAQPARETTVSAALREGNGAAGSFGVVRRAREGRACLSKAATASAALTAGGGEAAARQRRRCVLRCRCSAAAGAADEAARRCITPLLGRAAQRNNNTSRRRSGAAASGGAGRRAPPAASAAAPLRYGQAPPRGGRRRWRRLRRDACRAAPVRPQLGSAAGASISSDDALTRSDAACCRLCAPAAARLRAWWLA